MGNVRTTRRRSTSPHFVRCLLFTVGLKESKSNLRCIMAGQSTLVSHRFSAISRISGLSLITITDEGKSGDSFQLDTQTLSPFVLVTNAKARQGIIPLFYHLRYLESIYLPFSHRPGLLNVA